MLNKKSNDHLTNDKTFCREIWLRSQAALKNNDVDVHTRLMRKYKDIPQWWFLLLAVVGIAISIATVEGYKLQLQLPWWGILLGSGFACFFTLPIGIIAATTNQVHHLHFPLYIRHVISQ